MQIGIYSSAQLELHDHYDYNSGGPILTLSRIDSANIRVNAAAMVIGAAGVGTWSLFKRIVFLQDTPGVMTLTYTLTRAGGAGTVHAQARMYHGGTLLWSGTDNSTAAGPTDYTDATIAQDLQALDTVDVWGYVSAGATTRVALEALVLSWDCVCSSISRVPVTIPLAITGGGIQTQVVS